MEVDVEEDTVAATGMIMDAILILATMAIQVTVMAVDMVDQTATKMAHQEATVDKAGMAVVLEEIACLI